MFLSPHSPNYITAGMKAVSHQIQKLSDYQDKKDHPQQQ